MLKKDYMTIEIFKKKNATLKIVNLRESQREKSKVVDSLSFKHWKLDEADNIRNNILGLARVLSNQETVQTIWLGYELVTWH